MKIAHLSDTHIGYRAFSKTHKLINLREWDVLHTFRQALMDIVKWKPDLVIHSGDLFDKPHPGRFSLINAVRMLKQFAQLQVPIIIVSGNHDTTRVPNDTHIFSLLQEILPGNVYLVYGETRRFAVETAAGAVEILAVPAESVPNLTEAHRHLSPEGLGRYAVAVIHGISVKLPTIFQHGPWLVPGDLLNWQSWHYVAWGDYHDSVQLADNAYYAGATDYTSGNIWAECRPKGWLQVRLSRTGCKVAHVATTPRPHLTLVVQDEMPDIPDVTDSVVRVVYENRAAARSLHPELMKRLADASIVHYVHRRTAAAGRTAEGSIEPAVPIEERWRQFANTQPKPQGIDDKDWSALQEQVILRGIEALTRCMDR